MSFSAKFIRYRIILSSSLAVAVFVLLWLISSPVFAAVLKVDICHATGSVANPYTQLQISINSAADCTSASGHDSHTNDIIPIFTYETCTYPGKNWTAGNQAIW